MRKLNFKEVMLLAKIIREIALKEYIKTLNVEDFQEGKQLNKDKLALDLITHTISSIDLAESTIYQLVGSYQGIDIQEVPNMDGENMVKCFMDMFTNGVPQIIKDLLRVDSSKKKIEQKQNEFNNMCDIFTTIGDNFTDENILEPIMYQYKDFKYIDYVMGLSFLDGLKLWKKCQQRFKDKSDLEQTKKIWDLYLLEIQNGCKDTFEDYYNKRVPKEKTMYNEIEEKNIIDKYKDVKMVKRRF